MDDKQSINIHSIKPGDVVMYDGAERVVIATYSEPSIYAIAVEDSCGWELHQNRVDDWQRENSRVKGEYSFAPNWKDFEGKYFFWKYSALGITGIVGFVNRDIPAKVGVRKEHPCPQCKRMNDDGVSSCWHCERPNP